MKAYLILLVLPIFFMMFSVDSTNPNFPAGVSIHKYNIDSLSKENDSIKHQIFNDIELFKNNVDSINTITKNYIAELSLLDSDVTIDTIKTDSVVIEKKKKGWVKRTLDKIKN